MTTKTRLTNKQRAFVAEYLKDCNGTQAAIRAGYSAKSAASIASENLTKPKIQRAIEDAMTAHAMTPEEVTYRLSLQARGNMADFVDLEAFGVPRLDLKQAARSGALHLVKRLSFDGKTGMLTDVELYDAQGALKQLARIHQMMDQKLTITHDWQKQLEDEGVDAGDTFAKLIQAIAASEG